MTLRLKFLRFQTSYQWGSGSSALCRVLSRLFRRRFLKMLIAAHQADRLKFFGNHASLAAIKAFRAFLAPLEKLKWVVYAKKPFSGPEPVLRYMARYTHRVAISNERLVAADDGGVAFRRKGYRLAIPHAA